MVLVLVSLACIAVQVCCALSQVAKHSVDLAEVVVGAEIFPKVSHRSSGDDD